MGFWWGLTTPLFTSVPRGFVWRGTELEQPGSMFKATHVDDPPPASDSTGLGRFWFPIGAQLGLSPASGARVS